MDRCNNLYLLADNDNVGDDDDRSTHPQPAPTTCCPRTESIYLNLAPSVSATIQTKAFLTTSEVVAVKHLLDFRPFISFPLLPSRISTNCPDLHHTDCQIPTSMLRKTQCARSTSIGHCTFNCKAAAAPYWSRLSWAQMVENLDAPSGVLGGKRAGGPNVEAPDELLSARPRSEGCPC